MILTYKGLRHVEFPVYRLPSDNWHSIDGLLYVDNEIVDDKNMPGETLGIRRAQTYFSNLLPLKRATETFLSIIKQPGGPYIDSLGRCFIYEKTKFCKVKYYKIKEIEGKVSCSILRVYGIKFPFTIPRPPKAYHTWVGILHLNGDPWILYEYAESRLPDMRRKI